MSDSEGTVDIVTLAPADNAPSSNSTSLYVGDLHVDVGEKELSEIFSRVGSVTSIRICRDTLSGVSRGYGYVNFASPDDGERFCLTILFRGDFSFWAPFS